MASSSSSSQLLRHRTARALRTKRWCEFARLIRLNFSPAPKVEGESGEQPGEANEGAGESTSVRSELSSEASGGLVRGIVPFR